MKGFFGAFFVFLLWLSVCIYYVSTKKVIPSMDLNNNSSAQKMSYNVNEPSISTIIKEESPNNTIAIDSSSTIAVNDSLSTQKINKEESQLLAEEIQKSIAISDTIDITINEPELNFEKEIEIPTGPSFSSKIFYPRYNNTDLILDKELVDYATELKNILKNDPDKKVTILGHTDNVGSSRDNFDQGLKKSRQIKWYLTARRGISRRKITATSRGEEEPIASNKTRAGRLKNNRIEIIID